MSANPLPAARVPAKNARPRQVARTKGGMRTKGNAEIRVVIAKAAMIPQTMAMARSSTGTFVTNRHIEKARAAAAKTSGASGPTLRPA